MPVVLTPSPTPSDALLAGGIFDAAIFDPAIFDIALPGLSDAPVDEDDVPLGVLASVEAAPAGIILSNSIPSGLSIGGSAAPTTVVLSSTPAPPAVTLNP